MPKLKVENSRSVLFPPRPDPATSFKFTSRWQKSKADCVSVCAAVVVFEITEAGLSSASLGCFLIKAWGRGAEGAPPGPGAPPTALQPALKENLVMREHWPESQGI